MDKLSIKRKSRKVFSPEEDKMLYQAVQMFGTKDWSKIASKIDGRTTRQCKERWMTYLSPCVNKSPWTREEEDLLFKKYVELGPKWARISSFFHGRPDNMIKNHWNATVRKRERYISRIRQDRSIFYAKTVSSVTTPSSTKITDMSSPQEDLVYQSQMDLDRVCGNIKEDESIVSYNRKKENRGNCGYFKQKDEIDISSTRSLLNAHHTDDSETEAKSTQNKEEIQVDFTDISYLLNC